jgi:hypothetical protein
MSVTMHRATALPAIAAARHGTATSATITDVVEMMVGHMIPQTW